MNEDDLTRELQHLPREKTPPEQVREVVARAVQAQDHRRRTRIIGRVAIAASMLIGAFLLGRLTAPAAAPQSPPRQFALLLYGGESDAAERDRASEYRAWALEQRREGRAISGE